MTTRTVTAAALVAALMSTPAAAYHEGTYGDRVRYCATEAYALVEALETFVRGFEYIVAVIDTATTQYGRPAALLLAETVTKATQGPIERVRDVTGTCLTEVEGAAKRDAAANQAAMALTTELEFALDQIDNLDEALRTRDAAVRRDPLRGTNDAAPVAAYRSLGVALRGQVAALLERARRLAAATQ